MPTIKLLIISTLLLILSFFSQSSLAQTTELTVFGDNPGDLTGSYYSPNLKSRSIVVVLHGCAQQGETLARQSGLLGLAKQHNFALLLPQQGLTNNIKRCFNWYSNEDFTKDKGESLSIKNMILTLKQQLASEKIYLVGLSGGGAMASSLLVNYPEIFEAGAVIAGIPFPCADGLITGISCMRNGPSQTANELATIVKQWKPEQVVWPKLSVWTGTNDSIVNPLNSLILARQWAQLSKITTQPVVVNEVGYKVTHWQNDAKEVQIELVEVKQLGHGIMVNPSLENGGKISSYLLEAPISTAKHLVDFWGL